MSRRLLRCDNRMCPVAHGEVLGRLTDRDGIVLAGGVRRVRVHLDAGRADIACPACGAARSFRGRSIVWDRDP